MEQITLIKRNGSEINLFSSDPIRFVTQALQDHTLMANDTVKLTVRSTEMIAFEVGDKIRVVNDEYHIRTNTVREIVSDNEFVYEVTFYGVIYELMKSQYRDTDVNGVSSRSSFDLTYSLKDFVKVVINNVSRDYPGVWAFDEANCPDTDPRLMSFSKQNCLNALQTICQEFKQDFQIVQNEGIRTIKVGRYGAVVQPPSGSTHFEFGKGKGLYRLKENKVDDKAIISRLWVEGGSQNIKSNYRDYSERLQLPYPRRLNTRDHTLHDGTVVPAGSQMIGITSEAKRYIEDTDLSAKLGGVVEDTEFYEHIHPQRTGVVTALGGDVYSFVDADMFDLNEKNGEGDSLYILNEVSPKITFIDGLLAGQQFELGGYDHATKTLRVIKYTDERGLSFPTEDSTAFRIGVGDRYKITDILLPQSYVDDAEEDLWFAGYDDFLMRKQARVQYGLTFPPDYFKSHLPGDVDLALFKPGDYVPLKDERFDVEKNIRIVNVQRNLLEEHDYALTLSDSTSISIINDIVRDVISHENIIVRNRLKDLTKSRLAWRTTEELRNMVFDTDGFFDMGNIRPLSIDTNMLTVGTKSQQFVLVDVVLEANKNGDANRFDASEGILAHMAIQEDSTVVWNMAGISVNLADTGGYYVYAKCSKDDSTGVWHITQDQLKAEDVSDPNNYYFQVGIIGSLNIDLSFRDFSTTYGFTRTNGRTITTGRISSANGRTYIDLDENVIAGNIRFLFNGDEQDLDEWANDVGSNLNGVKAITDKFGTTVEGGLINTVMMLLRDLNSIVETAGISGIQGELKNNPAFWAGGTYAEAFNLISFLLKISQDIAPDAGEYDNLAKITMLHNGAAKVGDFIIEESGRIVMIDPSTGKIRLAFTVYNLPPIADLMSSINFSGSTNIGAATAVSSSQILSGSTTVSKDGSSAYFGGATITINAAGQAQPGGLSSYARAILYARRNGVRYMQLAEATVMFTSTDVTVGHESRYVAPHGIISVMSGTYTFELVVTTEGSISSPGASVTASSFSWEFTQQNVRMQQYGLDGMMFFYSNHHFHFTEEEGMDGRALPDKWNTPGVIAKGRITAAGARVANKNWGAKNVTLAATKISTGSYRVPVNCPNEHYDVFISPRTANRVSHVNLITALYFEVFFRDNNGNLADSEFSYAVIGNNYN